MKNAAAACPAAIFCVRRMILMDRKSPIDSHIGQRLKEYRQHRGMTVRELADAAHVTPGQISRYEHGRDRISHERVTEFARILRIKSNDPSRLAAAPQSRSLAPYEFHGSGDRRGGRVNEQPERGGCG